MSMGVGITPASVTFRLQLYSEGVANLSSTGLDQKFLELAIDQSVIKLQVQNVIKCKIFHFALLFEILIEKCSF